MDRKWNKGKVFFLRSSSRQPDLPRLLDATALASALHHAKRVLIKPNVVEALPPPITTPTDIINQLIDYIREVSDVEVVIGEGTGSLEYDTWYPFEKLGYKELARTKNVRLIDLNTEECIRLSNPKCKRWPDMFLPRIVLDSFLISVPVLKAHTLAGVTISMKNMMGMVPPRYYQQGGAWKKSAFHTRIQEAIADLNRYRSPDFSLLDARIGMAQAHLHGPHCDPPVKIVAASFDPVAIDAYGAGLLHRNWRRIGHIAHVNGEIGQAEPLEIIEA